MSTGLKIPVQVDRNGRVVMESGEDHDRTIIMTALSDCDSNNAFQELGLGSDMIFDITDNLLRAQILARLERIFAEFEAEMRYKLVPESVKWSTGEGELILEFRYFNMEADEEKEFTRRFSGRE